MLLIVSSSVYCLDGVGGRGAHFVYCIDNWRLTFFSLYYLHLHTDPEDKGAK